MKTLVLFISLFCVSNYLFAANCEKNPSHPSCSPAPPPSSVEIDSVIIDRTDAQVEVAGTGLSGATVSIGGQDIPGVTGNDTALTVPFGTELAAVVSEAGNYTLQIEDIVLSVYFDGPVVDVSSVACPCGDFTTELANEGLTQTAPNCLIVSDTQLNSGYLAQSYPATLGIDTVYIIGSAFVPDTPNSSVCRMERIDDEALWTTLLIEPIGSIEQHQSCEAVMLSNQVICGQAASP